MSEDSVEIAKRISPWKKIIIGLVVLAVICGVFFFFLAHTAQTHVEKFLKANNVTYSSLEVNWRRHFIAHEAKLNFSKDIAITIATIKGDVSFSGKTSKNLALEDIAYHIGKTDVSVPLLILKNYTIATQTDNKNADNRFDVENVAVKKAYMPTVSIKRKTALEEQNMSYTNVAYNDLDKGLIKKITTDGLSLNGKKLGKNGDTSKDELVTMTSGKIVTDNLNIGHVIRYYTDQSSPTDTSNPFVDLMSAWSVENIIIDTAGGDDQGVTHISFNRLSGTKFTTRLLPFSLIDFIVEADNLELGNVSDPVLLKQVNGKGLDILMSIGAADMNIDGLAVKTNQDTTEVQNLSIAYQNEHFDFAVKGIEMLDDNGKITLDNFSISDLHFANALTALKKINEMSSDPGKNMSQAYQEATSKLGFSLLPKFKNIHFDGLVVPATNVGTNQENPPVKINSFDADANFTLGAIPTSLKLSLKGIEISAADWDKQFSGKAIPDITQPQQSEGILEALGYDKIKADLTFDAAWNSEKETIDINEISVKYSDVANVSLKATLSNVDQALFSDNAITIAAAALGIHAQSIDLSANADDFLKRYEKLYDSNTGEKFSDVRKQTAIKTRLAIALALGAENSQNMGEALQNFIQDGGTLNIHAKAKSQQGIGLSDILEAEIAPLSLLDKIDLSAQTQH